MRYVTDAEYAGGYRLRVEFDDHVIKEVDLGPHLDGPVFLPLKDTDYFRNFHVDGDIDTVAWPNGADFAPEFLYEIGEQVGRKKQGKVGSERSERKVTHAR